MQILINTNIFILIDDTYLNTIKNQKLNKNCFRVLCVHQGKNNQNELINKLLITINIKNKNKDEFTFFLKENLEKIYGSLDKYKIIFLSDGAKIFKYLVNKFNFVHVLDKFHCFRMIRNTLIIIQEIKY